MVSQILVYPVAFAVSRVIEKVIDYKWVQPQVHQNNQERLDTQHQLRIKELEKQYQNNILLSLKNSEIRINEQEIIERLRQSINIETKTALRNITRDEENSPFYDGIETIYESFKRLYEETQSPIVLVSPFWDDTKPTEVNDKGGGVDFRNAFNVAYSESSWTHLANKQDGHFKRPLYKTDRDIQYVYSALSQSNIPIILVHGTIQGVHTSQQIIQRVHPHITFWNLFPEEQNSYTRLDLKFFPLQLPMPMKKENASELYKQIGEYSLDLQDAVGKYLSDTIGLLCSFYHLYHYETRPNLSQFQIENHKELELVSNQIGNFYDLLSRKNPQKVMFYIKEREALASEIKINSLEVKSSKMKRKVSGFNLESINVRPWFSSKLREISQIIADSEQKADQKGGSGKLELLPLIDKLNEQIDKLNNGKFRFLIIGDFNRGKSTILNAFFEKNLLPIGATATTAIPTFVKYGKEAKVIIHKKNGSPETLSVEEYKDKYTLNSKKVKHKIKRFFDSNVAQWLNPLDYAEFFCPLEILSKGVEFIDTAGLNHTEEENKKTFSYIEQSQAILFVLGADTPFTEGETNYLERLRGIKQAIEDSEQQAELNSENSLQRQVRPIFYLINKWELVSEDDKQEVHDEFVEQFSQSLNISEEEAENMWGDTVFDVFAKTALNNLQEGKSLNNTGLTELQVRLDNFLINERLSTELNQAVSTVELVMMSVYSAVENRLGTLQDGIEELEDKIRQAEPHINLMQYIANDLKNSSLQNTKSKCVYAIKQEYLSYFNKLIRNFEKDFEMPNADGLGENQRQSYAKNLEARLTTYKQNKLEQWHKIGKGILSDELDSVINLFDERVKAYSEERNKVQNILRPKNLGLNSYSKSSDFQNNTSDNKSLETLSASGIGKRVLVATGGTVGTAALGVGSTVIANLAGLQLGGLLTIGSAGLALTPLGWGLAAGSLVAGGIATWWNRRGDIRKFEQGMLSKAKEDFEVLLEEKCIDNIGEQVELKFKLFEEIADQLYTDVISLRTSLNNLLETKKTTQINSEKEALRLQNFKDSIFAQLQITKAKYNEIFPNQHS